MNKKTIHYKPGELHAVQLDDNTVALIMPTDYAATVRDVARYVSGHSRRSRRRYTDMIKESLSGLKDFPPIKDDDIESSVHLSESEAMQ